MNIDIDRNEISPAPDNLKIWLDACYGRVGNLTERYRNIIFSRSGEARVAQIAGWLTGLCHAGQRELATKIAADISSNLEWLNTYGGMAEGLTFEDGSPVKTVSKYMITLDDDGTFGGFSVCWWVVTPEAELDVERFNYCQDRWGERLTVKTWGGLDGVRDPARFVYRFAFNGGLLYHGPAGGEVFAVTLGGGDKFWGIHT
jgi:hypothetical protein